MLAAGSRIGPYEIQALIGVGGMGEVYRAHDTRLRREVAMKLLPEDLAADADRLARFQREAELLAALNHPNIATLYGLEDAGSRRALVMELVEGDTLAERISHQRRNPSHSPAGPDKDARTRALPIEEALPIARQIAEALETAHERGVVHRDLKPANIKVTADGKVKVLDFGLSKLVETAGAGDTALSMSPTLSVPTTVPGIILGTAAYMSPEQARGKAIDRRTDVWAFGCV